VSVLADGKMALVQAVSEAFTHPRLGAGAAAQTQIDQRKASVMTVVLVPAANHRHAYQS
jgi:hypothetical protein